MDTADRLLHHPLVSRYCNQPHVVAARAAARDSPAGLEDWFHVLFSPVAAWEVAAAARIMLALATPDRSRLAREPLWGWMPQLTDALMRVLSTGADALVDVADAELARPRHMGLHFFAGTSPVIPSVGNIMALYSDTGGLRGCCVTSRKDCLDTSPKSLLENAIVWMRPGPHERRLALAMDALLQSQAIHVAAGQSIPHARRRPLSRRSRS